MNDMPMKKCTKCGRELPATTEYFYPHKNKNGRTYLRSWCKTCTTTTSKEQYRHNPDRERRNNRDREWRKSNPKKAAQYSRTYRKNNPEKYREQKRNWRARNKDKTSLHFRAWRVKNLEYDRERHRKWDTENAERRKELARRWRAENIEHRREYDRRRRLENPERHKAWCRSWVQRNPDKRRLYTRNRQARKKSLPDTFTHSQWIECLEWWDHSCAYCGNRQGLFRNMRISMDHYIPLTSVDCPGTTIGNIIPACSACNSSKSNAPAEIWIKQEFKKRHPEKILKRIAEYFEWVKSSGA